MNNTEDVCDELRRIAIKLQGIGDWTEAELLGWVAARLVSLEGEVSALKGRLEWWKVEATARTGTDASTEPRPARSPRKRKK